jgi:predicted nucleic acid-binding protein
LIYALDTMIISEARKPRPHGAVVAWFAATPISHYGIPAVVFYELQEGAEMTRRQDRSKSEQIDRWIESLAQRGNVLPFGAEVARETARLMDRQSSHLFEDAAIAATARVHDLTVATRNTRDFERFDVRLINPFLFGK